MNTEQASTAQLAARRLGARAKVAVLPPRLEDGRGQKTGHPETRTRAGYGLEGLGRTVECIGAAGALDVDVDESRRKDKPARIEYLVSRQGADPRFDPRDGAVCREHGARPRVVCGIVQSAVLDKQGAH